MARLWLVSITGTAPVTIGADRMAVAVSAEWESFRDRLHAVHPRLLPLFKARLLLSSDDDEESCGRAESGELELENDGPIVFGGADGSGESAGFRLSHCAEAFLNRLLEPQEALGLLQAAEPMGEAFTEKQRNWLETMNRWWLHNSSVVLLSDN